MRRNRIAAIVPTAASRSRPASGEELRLGASIKLRVPYRSPQSHSIAVSRVLFEVGWLPDDEASAPKRRTADGHEFAYRYPKRLPGGQRLTRSPPLSWSLRRAADGRPVAAGTPVAQRCPHRPQRAELAH